jgi:hypothetical protein
MVQQMLGMVVVAVISFTGGAGKAKNVSLSVKEATVNQAIMAVVDAAGGSASFVSAEMPETPKVTLEFKNVAPEKALSMIAQAAGLRCEESEEDPGSFVISRYPWPATVKVGGGEVPILGAAAERTAVGPKTYLEWLELLPKAGTPDPLVLYTTPSAPERAAEGRPSFDGEDRLADLDVKDAPLSEVAEKLSWKPPALPSEGAMEGAAGERTTVRILPTDTSRGHPALNIVAADPVKDIRVTAKVYRWPVGKVLDMLLEQTGVVCSKEETGSRGDFIISSGPGGAPTAIPLHTITLYLTPRPELAATGPWVQRLRGGIGTGGGGGGGQRGTGTGGGGGGGVSAGG